MVQCAAVSNAGVRLPTAAVAAAAAFIALYNNRSKEFWTRMPCHAHLPCCALSPHLLLPQLLLLLLLPLLLLLLLLCTHSRYDSHSGTEM